MEERARPREEDVDRTWDRRQRAAVWRMPRESDDNPTYGGHGALPVYGGHDTLVDDFIEDALVYSISHMVMPVSNLDRSEAWYRDFLGFEVVGRNLTNERSPHSVLRMNTGQLLILVEAQDFVLRPKGTSGIHQAFTMTPNEYRRLIQRARELNWPCGTSRAQFLAHGQYTLNTNDPDDHHVEVNCVGPEASEILMPGAGVIDCGPSANYKVGDVKLFKDGNFFLTRVEEGFLALSRWCMHMNGKIIWDHDHWRFWCPFHEATYDRRGDPNGLKHPGLNALRLNPIIFAENGHILVDADRVIERDLFEPSQAVEPPVGGFVRT